MSQIAVVIFREMMEIALLLGIILAATQSVKNSRYYILLGILIGVVFSAIFASSARFIVQTLGGIGDELFNVIVRYGTVLTIIWTVVWMQGYSRKIKHNFDSISEDINKGISSKFMLATVSALTILREGVEIILLIYSIVSANSMHIRDYIIGLSLGVIGGLVTGILLYTSLIKFAGRYLFTISSYLLILIAAGIASEASGILTSIGIIDVFDEQIWDTSWLISDYEFFGKFLKLSIGYNARPTLIQLYSYLSTIFLSLILIYFRKKLSSKR